MQEENGTKYNISLTIAMYLKFTIAPSIYMLTPCM